MKTPAPEQIGESSGQCLRGWAHLEALPPIFGSRTPPIKLGLRIRDPRRKAKRHLSPTLPNSIGGEGVRSALIVPSLVGVFSLMPLTPALSPSDGAREKRLDAFGFFVSGSCVIRCAAVRVRGSGRSSENIFEDEDEGGDVRMRLGGRGLIPETPRGRLGRGPGR